MPSFHIATDLKEKKYYHYILCDALEFISGTEVSWMLV